MNILVANNHLERTGGTENYTYTIITELLRLGHSVEYFTFHKGDVSDKIESLGVKFKSKNRYDLILANHATTVEALYRYGCIIQTCHGVMPQLEQPSQFADYHISISYEVQQHLKKEKVESIIINNSIDCSRFHSENKINDSLTSVLSLCQSEEANNFISECCKDLGVTFTKLNKHIDNSWYVEKSINSADLIVGIGRSLYDAMACGRAVISYDNRDYSMDFGDGYLNKDNIMQSLKYNCSGRGTNKTFTKESFIQELKKYNKSDGVYMREFALENLNIEVNIIKYLNIFSISQLRKIKRRKRFFLIFFSLKEMIVSNLRILKKLAGR
ncbi:MAG: hypothetical protein LBR46_03950 [Prevotella sp.]|jgi:glycosyltransferase involved in cell wall biosynthesis|nr:hypothetical protein [Prevotella sp.]